MKDSAQHSGICSLIGIEMTIKELKDLVEVMSLSQRMDKHMSFTEAEECKKNIFNEMAYERNKFGNRQVIDLRENQNGTGCFKWKALFIEGNQDVFLKYYDGDKLDNCTYNAKGLFQVFPNPFVIIKEGNEYASYDYYGDVMVERTTKRNIRTDIIINLENIINDIEDFINKGNTPE